MKQPSTLVLKAVIALMGLLVIAICVFGLPNIIGSFDFSGYDPILLGLYIPAIPFFIALYQAMSILSFIDSKRAFTRATVKAFKNIKICAIAISSLFIAGMPYIFYVADGDDAPGVVAIALIIIFLSFVIGTFASVMQKLIQNAVEIKSENDLTV
jgi:hypothetical protein